MRKYLINREDLENMPLAPQTNTYVPVPNHLLVNKIEESLDKSGFSVSSLSLETNRPQKQLFGVFRVAGDYPDFEMALGFRNSSNRTLPVGIVSGVSVVVCSNLAFGGTFRMMRKHTVNVMPDLDKMINDAIGQLNAEYSQTYSEMQYLKSLKLESDKVISQMIGELYFSESLLRDEQISALKKNIIAQKQFGKETMFDFLMHVTDAVKSTAPSSMITVNSGIYKYIMKKSYSI